EFGFRMPFAFDVGKMGGYDNKNSVLSDEYGGLYARGNIENLFSTKADFHGLIGFTFYPSSSGEKLSSPEDLEPNDATKWEAIDDSTINVNILDSYALMATTVQVPIKLSFIGRLTTAPGFHYMKVAHRLKDTRTKANDNGELYERTYFDDKYRAVSDSSGNTVGDFDFQSLNDDKNSFTRLNSFYIRFDLLGQIGQKPNFIEKLSFLDFIQISKVPFYEFSFQYITGLNMIYTLNLNLSDDFGVSITGLKKNAALKGNWMPDSKLWVGLKYRANF
ncbi:MAG: hypothetical protein P8L91_06545, partial [Candidatus Marinimicrobia bacterium]|nr:hypothetical protein [Candidatus Neomarinimicrobiota bacterium]